PGSHDRPRSRRRWWTSGQRRTRDAPAGQPSLATRDHHRRVWAVDQRTAGRITRPELEAVRRQADLLEWRPSIPEQYYRPETLASARAHGACSSCLIGSVHGGLSRQMGASPTLESP